MPSASLGIELISEPFLVPVWFYAYSAAVYAASALISLLVTYYSYKFFKMSKAKSSIMFMFSFLFMTVAFSSLTFTSVYTYLYKPYFKENFNLGDLSYVNSVGFSIHYIASMIGYLAILMIYLPGDVKKFLPVLYLPLWHLDLMSFHIASILILAYVVLKNSANLYKKRDCDSFLVMFAFAAILVSHASLMFASFDATIYLAANSLLAVGFASFLIMLIRVNKSDRKKV